MSGLQKLIKNNWSVISYLIFGGLTTLINLVVFNVLYTWYHLAGYQVANLIAWMLSVAFAYITNKLYVFDSHQNSKKDTWRELGSFFFFRILSYFIDVVILKVGIDMLQKNPFWVKIIDNVVVVIANYFFSKLFVFKKRP